LSVPRLETPRLILSALTSNDTRHRIDLKTDPKVRKYLGGPLSIEDAETAARKATHSDLL